MIGGTPGRAAAHGVYLSFVGPWVRETDAQTLRGIIKPRLRGKLGVQGLANLNAYLYGDAIAEDF